MNCVLSGLPVPPQLHACFINNKKTGGRYPSPELKAYKQAMIEYRLRNLKTVNAVKAALVVRFPSEQRPIRIDRYVALPREKLFNKDGLPKSFDVTNTLKALDDGICEILLGIDDKWFFSGSEEKVVAVHGIPEVMVVMTLMDLPGELWRYRETAIDVQKAWSIARHPVSG